MSVLFNDEIIDLKYNDYNEIVTATNSKILKVFNRSTRQFSLLYGNQAIVLSIDLKKNLLVSGDKSNTVTLFARKGHSYVMCRKYNGHTEDVTAVVLSHSLEYIYSASNDKTIK